MLDNKTEVNNETTEFIPIKIKRACGAKSGQSSIEPYSGSMYPEDEKKD